MRTHKTWTFLGLGLLAIAVMASVPTQTNTNFLKPLFTDETTIWEIYEKLGKIKLHAPNPNIQGASPQRGEELVKKGFTTDQHGKKTKKQSKFYACIACHSTERETDNLNDISTQSRLDYAIKNRTPFLQGSTFHGIVNRVAFYNDDYQKKYAAVPDIKAANRDIRKAIHVCATQCAQGRPLADWETESILLYFWSLQLKIGDLHLTEEEKDKIEMAFRDEKSSARAIHLIEDAFVDKMPAHFVESPKYKTLTDNLLKDKQRFDNGKAIYELSCLHCHQKHRFSSHKLDSTARTMVWLKDKIAKDNAYSVYHLVRDGLYPNTSKPAAYMPQYPIEKLSEEQLLDLRIYIEAAAQME